MPFHPAGTSRPAAAGPSGRPLRSKSKAPPPQQEGFRVIATPPGLPSSKHHKYVADMDEVEDELNQDSSPAPDTSPASPTQRGRVATNTALLTAKAGLVNPAPSTDRSRSRSARGKVSALQGGVSRPLQSAGDHEPAPHASAFRGRLITAKRSARPPATGTYASHGRSDRGGKENSRDSGNEEQSSRKNAFSRIFGSKSPTYESPRKCFILLASYTPLSPIAPTRGVLRTALPVIIHVSEGHRGSLCSGGFLSPCRDCVSAALLTTLVLSVPAYQPDEMHSMVYMMAERHPRTGLSGEGEQRAHTTPVVTHISVGDQVIHLLLP